MAKEKDYEFICENVILLYDKIFPLYIVKGEKNFLIDSGATSKAPEFYERINKVLAETGGRENEKIDTLMLTHSHWDHTGGSFYLQQKYKFKSQNKSQEKREKMEEIIQESRLDNELETMKGIDIVIYIKRECPPILTQSQYSGCAEKYKKYKYCQPNGLRKSKACFFS